MNVLFTNGTCEFLQMYWVRPNGEQVFYHWLEPGANNIQLTWVGHVWLIKRADGTPYAVFRIEEHAYRAQEIFLGCAKRKETFCN